MTGPLAWVSSGRFLFRSRERVFGVFPQLIAEIHVLMGTPAKAASEAAQAAEQAPAQPAAPASEIHAL
jgi:hypothetical protein